jgi:hypothetical protein
MNFLTNLRAVRARMSQCIVSMRQEGNRYEASRRQTSLYFGLGTPQTPLGSRGFLHRSGETSRTRVTCSALTGPDD